MKRNMIRLTLGLAAMCVVVMGLESQADARLFGRRGGGSWGGWGGGHHGCHSHHSGGCHQQTSCCESHVQHDCGGCQSDCHSDCGCNGHHGRRGLFGRRHHRHHGGGCGCDSGCGDGCGGGCNGGYMGGGGEVIIDEGSSPSPAPAQNGSPAPAAPEAPPENGEQQDGQQGEQQEAPSA
jgi:hypothetical protein